MSAPQEQAAMETPMSSSLGAMGPILRKLDLLLAPEYPLRKSLKQSIELLKEDLEEVGAALVEQSMVDSPSNKAKYWMDEVRELSYDIEDYIDDMMRPQSAADGKVRSIHHFNVARLKINGLPRILKPSPSIARMAEIRTLLRESIERYERYQLELDVGVMNPMFVFTGHNHVPVLYKPTTDLVGIEESRKQLTEWLTNQEEKQLKVLSIVGPAGVGKTTLARALYRELKGQYKCRAFIRLSRKPEMSKILGEILSQVQGPKETYDGSALQNSIDIIREHLQDKRYFIVIDELWDATAWDILNNAFPKGNNCSTIIITAEDQDVIAQCCCYHSIKFFELNPLGSHDSGKLFFDRVFGGEHHCPDQLKEISGRIIKKCGGIPLVIITVADLLASELDNTDQWNQLLQCFPSSLANLTSKETLKEIVSHCYNSLPQYLKTCLLYLNMHPEGCTIWRADLLKQWIAERFVRPTEIGVAESYFDELIKRGLMQPWKISHDAEVVSCTIHHVVHDLITSKSSEQKFITAIDYSQTITQFSMKPRRLSLCFSCTQYAVKPEGVRLSQVRSLAFYGLHRCIPSIMEFKFLRVLILQFWGGYDDFRIVDLSIICILFQLRYLKVSSHIFVELPSQIQGLRFLETLEIDARVLAVPNDIALLPGLFHLSLRDGTKLPDGISRITSLQTLQYFDLGIHSEDDVRSLGQLINLRDLRLTCSAALCHEQLKRNLVALSSSLGRLANLRSLTLAPGIVGLTVVIDQSYGMFSTPIFLQKLQLSPVSTFSILPKWILKLQKLRILEIMVREILQNDIDTLSGFPDLTALSLCVQRPTAESVVFRSGAFPALKYFKYQCGVLCLSFKDEALPNLQRLKLGFNVHRSQQYARMITGIENLFNLKEITLHIGAAAGADDHDRINAESAFQNAICNHPRFHCLLKVTRVDWIEEEDMNVEVRHPQELNATEVLVSVLSGNMNPLLDKLTMLLGNDYILLKEVRDEIEFLHRELTSMEALVQGKEKPDLDTEDWRNKLREVIHMISVFDNLIDLFLHGLDSANDKDKFMCDFVKKLKRTIAGHIPEMKVRVLESVLTMRHQLYDSTMDDQCILEPKTPEIFPQVTVSHAEAHHEFVGMDGPVAKIVELLTWEKDELAQELQTVSILGPAGVGKTTLAIQVQHKIKEQFDYTAFVHVSESPNLTQILRNMAPIANFSDRFDQCQLIADVKDYIRGKRYLIIFDDIWSIEMWEHLKSILPQNAKKSRVITTTRLTSVAKSCCTKSIDYIYRMDGLNDAQSKDLFSKRIFNSGCACPGALDESVNEILEMCGGMPLIIIVLASLLVNMPKTEWKKFHSFICEQYGMVKRLSLCDVPNDLKAGSQYKRSLISRPIVDGSVQTGHGNFNKGIDNAHNDWAPYYQVFLEHQIFRNLEIFIWLKCLYLSVTNFTELPNEIGELPCLETLDLQGCELERLPSSISNLRNLCHLSLWPGVTFPNRIGDMKALEKLLYVPILNIYLNLLRSSYVDQN